MEKLILQPTINQTGIKYFYLSNLALTGRKFWIREEYNRKLIEKRPLNYSERKALKTLGEIISDLENQEKPVHLLEIFFSLKPWHKFAKTAGRLNTTKAKKIFKVLEPRWERFFRKKLIPELINGFRNLKRIIQTNQKFIQTKWQELEIIYGYSPP